MFISNAVSIFALGLMLTSSASAVPTSRQTVPQITCTTQNTDAPYVFLTKDIAGVIGGFNSTYLLSDALAAVGSTSSAGANPQVLQNANEFDDGFNTGFSLYVCLLNVMLFLKSFKCLRDISSVCASSYMKYPASTNGTDNIQRYYGHIQSGKDTCITRTSVADGHEFFTNSPCRFNDDAGQEAQYFQLKVVQYNVFAQEVRYNLTLLGHPQGATGDKFYFQPGTAEAPAITIARNEPSGYQLGMEYIHIN